jgi:hypothetical protein
VANEDTPEVEEVVLIEPTKELHPIHFMPNHGDPVAQALSRDFRPTAIPFRNDDDEVITADVPTEDGHGNMTAAGRRLVGNMVHPSQAKHGQKELPLDEQPTLTEQGEGIMTPPPPPAPPTPPESPAAPPNDDASKEPKKVPGIAAPKQGQPTTE